MIRFDCTCEKSQSHAAHRHHVETAERGIHRALGLRDRYAILFYLRDKGRFDRYAKEAARRLIEHL